MQALRVTLFPIEATAVSSEWWTDFTGFSPDNENRQPKDAIVVVSGAFEDKLLSLSSGVGRIDLTYQALSPLLQVPLQESQTLPKLTMGSVDTLLETTFSRIAPICARAKAVHRIALGGVFLSPVSSKTEAYLMLKGLLKSVAVQPERMSDLTYRVNWPIRDTAGRVVNRLGTWSSLRTRMGALGLTESPTVLSEDNYVNFESDLNTAPATEVQFQGEEILSELHFLRGVLEENLRLGEVF
ncbi:hypothetical protein ACM43_15830 [Bradyrhizobium sp. CCBAU 45321]|nr:hypothetical protein [Bradyrhizobium sp. CCBAU 45321]